MAKTHLGRAGMAAEPPAKTWLVKREANRLSRCAEFGLRQAYFAILASRSKAVIGARMGIGRASPVG